MINLNVRSVKRDGSSVRANYSVTVNRSLCEHCTQQRTCKALKSIDRAQSKYKIGAQIKECKSYIYPILFVDPKGTEGVFNTIRLGEAWLKRLEIGDTVGLIDKEGNVFGYAEVTDIFSRTREFAIRENAYQNHLYVNSGMTQAEAGRDLEKKLPNLYGNLIVKSNSMATVIYLKNCDIVN